MIDKILSINDFNKLFQNQVIIALGMIDALAIWKAWKEEGSNNNEPLNPYQFVRIGFITGGAPGWKITEDVCFLKCIEIDDPINKQRDKEYTPIDSITANEQTGYTRVFAISFTLYGPNSYNNSQKIKNSLFKSENRNILAVSGVFMVPSINAAVRFPELFQGQWWERTDLTINFNNLVTVNDVIGYIESADITVNDENLESAITINSPDNVGFVLTNDDGLTLIG